MKNNTTRIKNELPELLEAVCAHEQCPEWLSIGIWDVVNNRNHDVVFTADYWRAHLQSVTAAQDDALEGEAMEYLDDESPQYAPLTVIRGGVQ